MGTIEKELGKPIEELVEELREDSQEVKDEIVEKPEGEKTEEMEGPLEEVQEGAGEDFTEEPMEEPVEDSNEEAIEDTEKNTKKSKKVIIGISISICILIASYFGMAAYFQNRFYFGSEINCISVSGKTVEAAKQLMTSKLQDYTLTLKGRDGNVQEISGGDIGLRYSSEEEFENFKNRQNPFSWIVGVFNSKDSKMSLELSYDEELLRKIIDELSFFDSSKIIEPKNPSFQYVDNSYVIVDEVLGNKVDKEILYSQVKDAILKGKTEVDLEVLNCYVMPQYNSKSPKTLENRDTLNKYVSSKITYTIRGKKEVVDGSIINKWLGVNDDFEVTFDENKVREYVNELAKNYNTVGKTRSFVTSTGKTINIGGGDYGIAINKSKETQNLISAIKEGKTITKEPAYSQTTLSGGDNDIGNTYVEISISQQHIWFYKNGKLIVEGSIVTGNVSAGNATPKGVYYLKYKKRNAVLRGDDYESPVDYWMPFNGGIGMHDASWRSRFGGTIYKTNGSHGCVNCPYNVAKTIYNNIEPGTPVICY